MRQVDGEAAIASLEVAQAVADHGLVDVAADGGADEAVMDVATPVSVRTPLGTSSMYTPG